MQDLGLCSGTSWTDHTSKYFGECVVRQLPNLGWNKACCPACTTSRWNKNCINMINWVALDGACSPGPARQRLAHAGRSYFAAFFNSRHETHQHGIMSGKLSIKLLLNSGCAMSHWAHLHLNGLKKGDGHNHAREGYHRWSDLWSRIELHVWMVWKRHSSFLLMMTRGSFSTWNFLFVLQRHRVTENQSMQPRSELSKWCTDRRMPDLGRSDTSLTEFFCPGNVSDKSERLINQSSS